MKKAFNLVLSASIKCKENLLALYTCTLHLIIFIFLLSPPALALSDYGRKCDENLNCVKCRDSDVACSICLNNCWDRYGPPESEESEFTFYDKDELCRIRRAKWCSAQCWDPDDIKVPGYESTKPTCAESAFPAKPISRKD